MKFEILTSTYLKKTIASAATLKETDKILLNKNTALALESDGIIRNGHYTVSGVFAGITLHNYQLFAKHAIVIKPETQDLNTLRVTNDAGRQLIKSFEGLQLISYPDPGTGGKPYTCCYGHTGPEIKQAGVRYSINQCEAFLVQDLRKFEKTVTNLVHVSLTDNEFAALVSFAYNCGPANLAKSSALKLINKGLKPAGFKALISWNRAAGKVLPGLTRRRKAEIKLAGY